MHAIRSVALVALASVALFTTSCRRHGAAEPAEDGSYGRAPEDLDGRLAYAARAKIPEAVQVEVLRGVAMREDEVQPFGVNLSGGRCYWLVGVAEDSVRELALYLYDETGKRVDAKKDSTLPVMRACPIATARHQLKVAVPAGKGAFHVGLYTTSDGGQAPAGQPAPAPATSGP